MRQFVALGLAAVLAGGVVPQPRDDGFRWDLAEIGNAEEMSPRRTAESPEDWILQQRGGPSARILGAVDPV